MNIHTIPTYFDLLLEAHYIHVIIGKTNKNKVLKNQLNDRTKSTVSLAILHMILGKQKHSLISKRCGQ